MAASPSRFGGSCPRCSSVLNRGSEPSARRPSATPVVPGGPEAVPYAPKTASWRRADTISCSATKTRSRKLRDASSPRWIVVRQTPGAAVLVRDGSPFVDSESHYRPRWIAVRRFRAAFVRDGSPFVDSEPRLVRDGSPFVDSESRLGRDGSPVVDSESRLVRDGSPFAKCRAASRPLRIAFVRRLRVASCRHRCGSPFVGSAEPHDLVAGSSFERVATRFVARSQNHATKPSRLTVFLVDSLSLL